MLREKFSRLAAWANTYCQEAPSPDNRHRHLGQWQCGQFRDSHVQQELSVKIPPRRKGKPYYRPMAITCPHVNPRCGIDGHRGKRHLSGRGPVQV